MQLEKMIPHTEGNYTRCVFSDLSDAIQWLEKEEFYIENKAFLSQLSR
jgi:hypothetical protein